MRSALRRCSPTAMPPPSCAFRRVGAPVRQPLDRDPYAGTNNHRLSAVGFPLSVALAPFSHRVATRPPCRLRRHPPIESP